MDFHCIAAPPAAKAKGKIKAKVEVKPRAISYCIIMEETA
jgi:hypothetical protein